MLPVITEDVLVNVVEITSKRKHRLRRWDISGMYHRRIQKKWDKVFGKNEETKVLRISAGLARTIMFIGNPEILKNG